MRTSVSREETLTVQVSDIIYNASKGSKYFNREETRDRVLSSKVARILAKKAHLERLDLSRDLRAVDGLITELDASRDLSQYIVHVDCDAFYAAVELLGQPELAGAPFAVGGGVLSTCNYLARSFGCRSGMAGFVAKKLCPKLIILKPDHAKYVAKAQEVRRVLARYDPRFESASIDEAYLNVTEYCATHGADPGEVVAQLRREVLEETRVTVSAGIAANTRLAKICSNINKPNGQFLLQNERSAILDFTKTLACRKVNGIGRVFERELASVGIQTCGDIYDQRQYISRLFGEKACHFLVHSYLGLGRTSVQPAEEYERKSVGTESTFTSMSDPGKLRQQLQWTAHELEKDLRRVECKGRTLVLKLKLNTFEVHTRQVILSRAVYLADDLYKYASPMLSKMEQELPGISVRLLGLRCTNLTSTRKPDTLAFFGIRPPQGIGQPDSEATESEVPPDTTPRYRESLEIGAIGPAEPLEAEVAGRTKRDDSLAVEETPTLCYRQERTANPKSETGLHREQERWWNCPVCFRPQSADEKEFNDHMDACLSRRTILEAVQEHAGDACNSGPSLGRNGREQKREKRRGRLLAITSDPRQKRIRFDTM
ncbi:DNA-directed polymerase [Grosmannia clavigera kw1407]|uniref:DNA polymerase kappa n=1 Tax=Grosmannia clavigera (strain kw1407 / UAMH 11150) TaxID=655863 RepID=F0XJX7_GROCL|nr:DNA-directed polymerase [Grosmannia clavigera kw1407]EFX01985.1 DNA-directed polymerase [Grosmannia clavigera kw1407]